MTTCPMCRRWDDDADLRIAELEHSFVILNRDQFFPGYTLLFTRAACHRTVPSGPGSAVRSDGGGQPRGGGIVQRLPPDKINYELLGNMVPHIHWHLVPRFSRNRSGPDRSGPNAHELLLSPDGYRERIELIRQALA